MKKTLTVIWIFGFLFLTPLVLFGQEKKNNAEETAKKEKKVDINILPVVATNPTVGVLFGVLPGVNWNMGTPADTRNSTALIGVYYTTLNQLYQRGQIQPADRYPFEYQCATYLRSRVRFGQKHLGRRGGNSFGQSLSSFPGTGDDVFQQFPLLSNSTDAAQKNQSLLWNRLSPGYILGDR